MHLVPVHHRSEANTLNLFDLEIPSICLITLPTSRDKIWASGACALIPGILSYPKRPFLLDPARTANSHNATRLMACPVSGRLNSAVFSVNLLNYVH